VFKTFAIPRAEFKFSDLARMCSPFERPGQLLPNITLTSPKLQQWVPKLPFEHTLIHVPNPFEHASSEQMIQAQEYRSLYPSQTMYEMQMPVPLLSSIQRGFESNMLINYYKHTMK